MVRRLAPLLFVLSGIAGLVLQVAWFRLLAHSLGGTLAAATVVLSTFMGGLSLGAWFFGRRVDRNRNGLVVYGVLEIGAGLAALLSIPLLWALDDVHAFLAGSFELPALLVRLPLAAIVLLPATFFMGGTLPALSQALARDPRTAGGRIGGLYALNTLGAVLGTLLALFHLLPRVGLSSSIAFAAALDLIVAVAVLGAARLEDDARGPEDAPDQPAAEGSPSAELVAPGRPAAPRAHVRLLASLLFATGLAGIAYEVIRTRILAFYFGSGAHAFGLTLAVVLAGLAVGGFLGGELADRTGKPALVLAGSQALLAVTILYQLWRFPHLPDFLYMLALRVGDRIDFGMLTWLLLFGAVQVILPSALCMGAALPAAAKALVRAPGEAGPVVGRLAAANAAGTIPGAFVGAYVLIPWLGAQGALLALAGLGTCVAVVTLIVLAPAWRLRGLAGGVAGIALLLLVGLGVDSQRVFGGSGAFLPEGSGGELLRLDESAHGTVSLTRVRDSRGTWLSLSIDAVNVAGTAPGLLSCQALQGHLPLLLHPEPRSVLHVGFGSGGTAAAVSAHDSVERVDVVEINPTVLEFSRAEMRDVNRGVLDDPRVTPWIADGRNYLLVTPERYDVILSDSIHPRYRGNASLYTVEYFELCRDRLRPEGILSTWLPIYSLSRDSLRSIIASMREVFPSTSVWYLNSTMNPYVIVVGRKRAGGLDVPRARAVMAEPDVARSLAAVGIPALPHVLDFFIAEGDELDDLLGDVALHHDDHPWVELESAAVLDREASWLANFHLVVAARHSILPHLEGAEAELLREMERFEAATQLQLAGQVLFLSGRRAAAFAAWEEAHRVNPRDPEPWEYFGYPEWIRSIVGPAAGQRDRLGGLRAVPSEGDAS